MILTPNCSKSPMSGFTMLPSYPLTLVLLDDSEAGRGGVMTAVGCMLIPGACLQSRGESLRYIWGNDWQLESCDISSLHDWPGRDTLSPRFDPLAHPAWFPSNSFVRNAMHWYMDVLFIHGIVILRAQNTTRRPTMHRVIIDTDSPSLACLAALPSPRARASLPT